MAYCRGRDFLFCELCGNLLALGSLKFAKCSLCGFKRSLKEFEGKETRYTVTAEDIRRELKIEPFVKLEGTSFDMGEFKKPLINRTCPKCQHPQLEYTTRQMRSADEGQTTFYECPMRCGYTDVDG